MKKIALLSLFLISCGAGTEAPDPLLTVQDDCQQGDVSIRAIRERDGREVNIFDDGDRIVLSAIPTTATLNPLSGNCNFSRTASWTIASLDRALTCRPPLGETAGMSILLLCNTFIPEAVVEVSVKHGGFGNTRRFLVIR